MFLRMVNIVDNGVVKTIDINDPNNLKEIYSCKSLNGYTSECLFDGFVKADILRDYVSRTIEQLEVFFKHR